MDGVEGSLIFLRQELMIGGVRQILNDWVLNLMRTLESHHLDMRAVRTQDFSSGIIPQRFIHSHGMSVSGGRRVK